MSSGSGRSIGRREDAGPSAGADTATASLASWFSGQAHARLPRHGVVDLYAALGVATGRLVHKVSARHVATSQCFWLYPTPLLHLAAFAAQERFRAFADCSFSTCRTLRPRGSAGCSCPVHSSPTAMAFAQSERARHLSRFRFPMPPPSASGGALNFEASTFRFCYDLSTC